MNELVKEFQSERLELFAARLNQQKDMRANVCAISDSNNLWIIDGKLTGTISFFYGPLLLLPELFPDDWGVENGQVFLRAAPYYSTLISVKEYFGLSFQQIGHIFIPECQVPMIFGGNVLTIQASVSQLAKNIYALVESQKVIVSFIDHVNANYSKN
jgi:hypothetical protein